MKRTSITLAILIAFATVAFAQSLPKNAVVTVETSGGTAVGLGSIEHGQLSLELNASASALAGSTLSIAVTGASGTQTITATIDASGTITVTAGGTSQDLASYAKAAGLSGVEVSLPSQAGSGSSADKASGSGQAETSDKGTVPSEGDASSSTDHAERSAKGSDGSQAGGDGGSAQAGVHQSGSSSEDSGSVGASPSGSEGD